MTGKKPINIEIGQRVKYYREAVGMTQERLAELLNTGEKHLSAMERGAAGVSLSMLIRMCGVLSVSADALLFGKPTVESQREDDMQILMEQLNHLTSNEFDAAKEIIDRLLAAFAVLRKEQ